MAHRPKHVRQQQSAAVAPARHNDSGLQVPFAPPKFAKQMRLIRRLRRVAFYGLLAPVVITAALVGLNKVTDGAMAIFVNGDPWTHYFWNTLFGAMIVGIVALFLAK
ncbi:MAG: hypothetical protein U0163_00060, partial [Gemmatimonadaceae bacterium]